MRTNQPARRPPGTPVGGQFAPSVHPVPSAELDEVTYCDECGAEMPEGFGVGPEHEPSCSLHPDSVNDTESPSTAPPHASLSEAMDADGAWTWTAVAAEVGQERAAELFERAGGSLGKALALHNHDNLGGDTEVCDECGAEMPEGFGVGHEHDPSCSLHPDSVDRDRLDPGDLEVPSAWRSVGVHDPATLGRLQDHEVLPEDFTSDDRNRRHWAHYVRGDMVFEGELTGNAYEMHRHDSRLDPRSVFHWTEEVYVGGNTRRWDDLSAGDRLDYIAGCAEVLASDGDTASMLFAGEASARQAGRVRGRNIVSAQRIIEENPDPDRGFVIVDSDAAGRRLVVRNVRPAPERGGYEAEVAAGQYRRHYDPDGSGRTVPWTEGSRVFFRQEALGAS